MNSWQKAFNLAKIEMRHSFTGLIQPLIFMIFFAIVISMSTDSFIETNGIFLDVLFLIMFSFVPIWMRPKEMQIQKVNENGLWASPAVLAQLQLPISKDILIKSRFVIYFVYSLPIYTFLFLIIYLASYSFQETISFGLYIIFMIVWFSFYLALGIPATDTGQQLTIFQSIIYLILLMAGLIGLVYFFHFKLGYGIIHGSILLVKNWPLLSLLAATLLILISLFIGQRYMKRQLTRIDYF